MFKFLFEKMGAKAVVETQRETVNRAVDELNAVLALMGDRPKIAVDLNSGALSVELPDQMPDEALALPAPQEEDVTTEETAEVDAATNDVVEEKSAA